MLNAYLFCSLSQDPTVREGNYHPERWIYFDGFFLDFFFNTLPLHSPPFLLHVFVDILQLVCASNP